MLQAAMDSASVQANRISTRSNTDNTFIILGIQRRDGRKLHEALAFSMVNTTGGCYAISA
jgi:hypothetical protein